MALTTLAAVQAAITLPFSFAKTGVSGGSGAHFASTWYNTGSPAAGVLDTTTAFGVARSSTGGLVTGQIPFYDPAAGNTYLAKWSCNNSNSGTTPLGEIYLCDRLWDCGAVAGGTQIDVTNAGAQTITSAQWPDRDAAGGHTGLGIIVGLEAASTLGATPSTSATITYTNTAGTGTRTGALLPQPSSSPTVAGTFTPFALDVGDLGVQQVNSLTLGASLVSGSIALVAYRVIAGLNLGLNNATEMSDALTHNFPRLFNGTVPFFLLHTSVNTTPNPTGNIYYAQG